MEDAVRHFLGDVYRVYHLPESYMEWELGKQ